MTPIEQARARVIASKLWGRHCENAIRGGFWDDGSLVREALIQVEAEALRQMPEATE